MARKSQPGGRSFAARRPVSVIGAVSLAALLSVLMVFGLTSPASAHTGDQSYIYLDVTERSVAGRVEMPIVDLREALGLDLSGDDDVVLAELLANTDAIQRYADQHFDIGSSETQEWPMDFADPALFYSDLPERDDNYILMPFTVGVTEDTVPREFSMTFDMFFDGPDDRDALLLIENDWKGGVIENGWESLTTFDPSSRTQTIDLGEPSVFGNLQSSAKLGVNHIKTGPDHILFVLVLLLPSVLVFRNGWQPTDGFVSSLWRVLKVVTMFTVAHSITFTLAGLGLLPLPSPRIVESIIALSIAAAALHNIRPIAPNREWLISFAFGLFHGMGFASLVSGLDVSRSTQLVSLMGRNIGIEIGQAIVVLLLFPALFLLRRTVAYRPLFVAVSLLLTAVALGWMVERSWEVDLGISTVVDPVFEWPRALYYVLAFTALVAGYYKYEESNGRLLATAGEQHSADDDVLDTAKASV